MEIQQKEKESLATYIPHFKIEAKRCNFMNNTTNIRIFVKGLKKAHNLAACIYKKGPQTLTDAISEVEQLHATQQLTATLIPSSTVNLMSHEEDCCFQCQESGQIVCHFPNIFCFKCDEYECIVVDCPHILPPSGTPAHHHKSQSWPRHHNSSTSCHHPKIGTEAVDLNHNHTTDDTTAKVNINPLEHILGHNTETTGDIAGVVHANSI